MDGWTMNIMVTNPFQHLGKLKAKLSNKQMKYRHIDRSGASLKFSNCGKGSNGTRLVHVYTVCGTIVTPLDILFDF